MAHVQITTLLLFSSRALSQLLNLSVPEILTLENKVNKSTLPLTVVLKRAWDNAGKEISPDLGTLVNAQ